MSVKQTSSKKAISYLRYSSKDQSKGGSESRQLEWTHEYCDTHNLKLVDVYRDLGVSALRGKHSKKGNLARLLEDCASGKIPKGYALVIENFDRLSREEVPVALQRFLTLINDYELEIHTLDDNRVYRPGKIELTELIITIVIMGRAHSESARKSVFTTKAWKQLREAKALVKKPMGRLPNWIYWDEESSALLGKPEAVETIQYIFDLVTEKKLSVLHVSRRLLEEDVPLFSEKAKKWTTSMVSNIIHNRSLLGELNPASTKDQEAEVVPNYYPEVITPKQFTLAAQLVRSRINKSKGRPPKYSSQHAILTGVTYYLDERVHKGYYCSRRKNGDKVMASYVCKHENRNVYIGLADPLEHFICSIISELDDAEFSENSQNKALEIKLRSELATRKRELVRLNATNQNLLEAIKISNGSLPILVKQLESNEQEILLCQDSTDAIERQMNDLQTGSGIHDKKVITKLKKQALEGKDLQSRQDLQSALTRIVKRLDLAKKVDDLPNCSNDFMMHALTLHATTPVKFWARIELYNNVVILGAMTSRGQIARIRWEE